MVMKEYNQLHFLTRFEVILEMSTQRGLLGTQHFFG